MTTEIDPDIIRALDILRKVFLQESAKAALYEIIAPMVVTGGMTTDELRTSLTKFEIWLNKLKEMYLTE